MKQIKITRKDGVTLHTANKFVDDDLSITIDSAENITPENIAKDVTILGVTGTFEGGSSGNTLKAVLDATKSCYYLFNKYLGNNLNDLIKYNDTENVTNFSYMYNGCNSATTFPLIDTSNGTSFGYMYSDCDKATTFPLIDTSNGTEFNSMYNGCGNATSFPQTNTSNGTSFGFMYMNCGNATTFPLIDTSNGTEFNSMYNGCDKATELPPLNTSNGITFDSMYKSCRKVTTLPPLNTNNGTKYNYMFAYCYKAKKIDITKFTSTTASNTTQAFNGCQSLLALIIRSFGDSYVINTNTFQNCNRMLGTYNSEYNPNTLHDGYIYVPRDMIATLQAATNWSAMQFRALEDYTKDGTTTGEFDDEKAGLV